MTVLDHILLARMREMAREGLSVAAIYDAVKNEKADLHILDILAYFRTAFCLSLRDVKPICGFACLEEGQNTDEAWLEELVKPEIEKHRHDWDV